MSSHRAKASPSRTLRSHSAAPSYRNIPETPASRRAQRELLIFSCNPAEATGASLTGLDEEMAAVQDAYPKAADVKQVRNKCANELQDELRASPPRAFLFIGHADADFAGGVRTLYFVDGARRAMPVDPRVLARMLGRYSPSRGGPLELVFINGCNSSSLGEAVLAEGMPNVVCWETVCDNGAAKCFSKAFFRALQDSSCADAFEQAKDAVEMPTVRARNADGQLVLMKKFEIGVPPPGPPPTSYPCVVGVPRLLCRAAPASPSGTRDEYDSPHQVPSTLPETSAGAVPPLVALASSASSVGSAASIDATASYAGAGSTLVVVGLWLLRRLVDLPRWLIVDCLCQLAAAAERAAKMAIEERFATQSPPLSLTECGLVPGDAIVAEVTVGFTRRVSWPATVRSDRTVEWAAMPHVCPRTYGESYEGNVEFRLTHALGRSIYDLDERLYYRWRKQPAAAAVDLPGAAGAADATDEADAAEDGDGARPGVLSMLLITWLARALVIVLLAACVWAARAACPLCLILITPLVLQPLTSLLVGLCTLFVAVVLPRVARRFAEEGGDEEEATFTNLEGEEEELPQG